MFEYFSIIYKNMEVFLHHFQIKENHSFETIGKQRWRTSKEKLDIFLIVYGIFGGNWNYKFKILTAFLKALRREQTGPWIGSNELPHKLVESAKCLY
jgi:hypothetical protein